jgi:predicted Fe-Mo cluster-binding NifX family protein
MKIAVPTRREKGLRDTVAETFSRAPTYTIVTIKDGGIDEVQVIKNDAAKMAQGAGPIAARRLKENNVNLVLSGDIGPGARNILETIDISIKKVNVGQKVKEAINNYMSGNLYS